MYIQQTSSQFFDFGNHVMIIQRVALSILAKFSLFGMNFLAIWNKNILAKFLVEIWNIVVVVHKHIDTVCIDRNSVQIDVWMWELCKQRGGAWRRAAFHKIFHFIFSYWIDTLLQKTSEDFEQLSSKIFQIIDDFSLFSPLSLAQSFLFLRNHPFIFSDEKIPKKI